MEGTWPVTPAARKLARKCTSFRVKHTRMRVQAPERANHPTIWMTSSKKTWSSPFRVLKKKKLKNNHRTSFSVSMRPWDGSKYYMGQNFAPSPIFPSNRDQVPGIPVKLGLEISVISIFPLLLKIQLTLAISDACILFYAKFCICGRFPWFFSDFLEGVQHGQSLRLYVAWGAQGLRLGSGTAIWGFEPTESQTTYICTSFLRGFWDFGTGATTI